MTRQEWTLLAAFGVAWTLTCYMSSLTGHAYGWWWVLIPLGLAMGRDIGRRIEEIYK